MKNSDNRAQSTPLDIARRKRLIAVIGAILVFLLVIEIALQVALRKGWSTYQDMDYISAIAADGKGQVWVAGSRQGGRSLMIYSQTGKPVEVPMPGELTGYAPNALIIDTQDRLWVGTVEGIVGMRNANGEWVLYTPQNYENDSIQEMVMDGQGRVWVRSYRGPAGIDPGSSERNFTFTNSGLADSDAIALATDPLGQLWVLTRKSEIKVLEAEGSWRTVASLPGSVWSASGIYDDTLYGSRLAVDQQSQVWVATSSGIGVLSPSGGWTVHPADLTIGWLSLTAILPDSQSRIWVAPYENGLYRFDPETGWTNYTSRNSVLFDEDVTALALDPQGQVWIGSSRGRLNKYDPDTALPVKSIPAVRFGIMALVPAILLALFSLVANVRALVGALPGLENRLQTVYFALGFVAWYAVGMLMWWYLRGSSQPSGAVFFYINPLILLAPVVHLVLMVFLYIWQRQMARGAFSAIVVNSMAMLLMSPISAGSIGGALFGAILMIPFFLVF